MTDKAMADKIYIEPLTPTTIKRIIMKERPDSILSGLGGQTALTLCMQLAKDGFLEKMGVRLLGSDPDTIDKAEDRQLFKDTMESIGQPVIPSITATEPEAALKFAEETGYPVIIRPAFTLGGTGGGIAHNADELRKLRQTASLSPIHQILVEKSVAGWKEIEFEVMRDSKEAPFYLFNGKYLTLWAYIPVTARYKAPAVTLSDKEYQMLRSASRYNQRLLKSREAATASSRWIRTP